MIKITTASSSRVKPGDVDFTKATRNLRANAIERGQAESGSALIAPSIRLAGVYLARSVRTVGAAFAERLQRVGVPVALVEILVAPWIGREALDVTAGLVVGGRAAAARRRYQ